MPPYIIIFLIVAVVLGIIATGVIVSLIRKIEREEREDEDATR